MPLSASWRLTLFAAPAGAEFRPLGSPPEDAPPLNFCAQGKLLVFSGNCDPGPGVKKDSISRKACADVVAAAIDAKDARP